MKRLQLIFGRGALLAIAAFTALAASSTSTAQTVTVNASGGTNTVTNCTAGSTTLNVDIAGNIMIGCTVSGTTVFSCSATATPGSVQSGTTQTSTIQVGNCQNGTASGYAWTIPSPLTSTTLNATTSQNFSVTAPAGITSNTNYSFPVVVTGTGTTGTWSGSATLLVTAAAGTGGSSGGTGNCTSINGTFTKNGQFPQTIGGITLLQAGTLAYAIPAGIPAGTLNLTGPNNFIYFNSVQVTGTQANLGLQFAISTCAGDFSANVPANCSTWGTADTSATLLQAAVGATTAAKWGVSCIIQPATQYYLNVRMINRDLTTPSCSAASCQFIVQSHWNLN